MRRWHEISSRAKRADFMHKRRAQVVAGDAPRGAAAICNRDLASIGVRLLQQRCTCLYRDFHRSGRISSHVKHSHHAATVAICFYNACWSLCSVVARWCVHRRVAPLDAHPQRQSSASSCPDRRPCVSSYPWLCRVHPCTCRSKISVSQWALLR